jgi:integrase/recombinase XerD
VTDPATFTSMAPSAMSKAWIVAVAAAGRSPHTVAAYEGDVGQYVRHLDAAHVRDIRRVGPEDVEDFVRAFATAPGRSGKIRADSTVARVVSAVRSFHAWAASCGFTVDDPAAAIPSPAAVRAAPMVLERDEIAALLASVDGEDVGALRDRAVLSLLAATGIRAAEVVGLDTVDVLDGGRRLAVGGERPRPLPVADPRALRAWVARGRPLAGDADGALFPNARGTRLTRQWIWRLVTDRARSVDLPAGTSPRTLRNTFAALERAAGTPEPVVLELLGRTPWTGLADDA